MTDLDELAEVAAEAKQRYRDDPSPANRAAHRDASAVLNNARATTRPQIPVVSAGGDEQGKG